jgi:hypothetical protein
MKLNMWFDELSPAEARRLVSLIAEFEETLGRQLNAAVTAKPETPKAEPKPETPKAEAKAEAEPKPETPKAEAKAEAEQVIERAKVGRPKKAPAPVEAEPAPLNRDHLISKLRGAVQANYDACEAYLTRIGKDSFLVLTDAELAAACAELVK